MVEISTSASSSTFHLSNLFPPNRSPLEPSFVPELLCDGESALVQTAALLLLSASGGLRGRCARVLYVLWYAQHVSIINITDVDLLGCYKNNV